MADRTTYLLVDGENIDATLGVSVLGRRPEPQERPRWNTLLDYTEAAWDQPVKGLFFLAVAGELPASFVQALLAMGYTPIPLSGGPGLKVVDMGIQRTLEALVPRDADILLASHDGDFIPQIEALITPGRRIGVLCFREFVNSRMAELGERGVEFFDLEFTVGAFQERLPRLRVIPIDEFDPLDFL